MQKPDLIATASRFVNATNRHIFLTGKAGTGKTTFLKNLSKTTHKRFAIVAPTGIAALNAGGVTIHSQFQLPPGTFIPEEPKNPPTQPILTPRILAYKHPVSAVKKKVLREIDLLIIDEVSMLRADVLDAIDFRLRNIRRDNTRPFGGVQILFIGDLYQLPPVVQDRERYLLQNHYKSAFFYDAKSLQRSDLVYVELDKIFRQADDAFIRILNHIREDKLTSEDVEALNAHYHPNQERKADVVTLTTHNKQADTINREQLDKLEGKSFFFDAIVADDFPESMYPVDEIIELREGARIMFTKNDNVNNKFYNGKMATVTSLSQKEISVLIDDDIEPYTLEKMSWENKKYEVGADSQELEENIVGKFKQYPIKLAWAITIHKSQGLTFEKAAIDVAKAFASGQVYVALSRLKSLDGLVLESPINPSVISNDADVVAFSANKQTQEELDEVLPESERAYLLEFVMKTFSAEQTISTTSTLLKKHNFGQFESDHIQRFLPELRSFWQSQRKNLEVFCGQLHRLLNEKEIEQFKERLKKGSAFYAKCLDNDLAGFAQLLEEVRAYSKTKTIVNDLEELEQNLLHMATNIHAIQAFATALLEGEDLPKGDVERKKLKKHYHTLKQKAALKAEEIASKSKRKSGRKKQVKSGESTKGETYIKTLNMLKEGLTPAEISDKRGMAESTIHGHVSKLIGTGEINISEVMSADRVDTIMHGMESIKFTSLSELKQALGDDYDYNELRLVLAYRAKQMREGAE